MKNKSLNLCITDLTNHCLTAELLSKQTMKNKCEIRSKSQTALILFLK